MYWYNLVAHLQRQIATNFHGLAFISEKGIVVVGALYIGALIV